MPPAIADFRPFAASPNLNPANLTSMDPSNSGKPPTPSAAAGLSRPRLVKSRRHFTSFRARSASDVAAKAPASDVAAADWSRAFDHSKITGGFGLTESGGGGMGVGESIFRSMPFNPSCATRVPAGNGGNGGGNFVFGTSGRKNCDLGVGSRGSGFVFGAGSKMEFGKSLFGKSDGGVFGSGLNAEAGNRMAGKGDDGVFVFGSGVGSSSNKMSRKVGEGVGSDGNVREAASCASERSGTFRASASLSSGVSLFSTGAKSESVGFGCRAGPQANLGARNVGSSRDSANSFAEAKGMKSTHTFEFRSNGTTSSEKASTLVSDTVISDKMKKLGLQHLDIGDGLDKIKQSYQDAAPSNDDVFVFGTNIKSVPHSFTTISTELPNALNKLNIGSGVASENDKKGTADNTPQASEPSYKLPEAMNKSNTGSQTASENPENINFVHPTDFSGPSLFSSVSLAQKLPEVMNKLHLGNDAARKNMEILYANLKISDSLFGNDESKCSTSGQPSTSSFTSSGKSSFDLHRQRSFRSQDYEGGASCAQKKDSYGNCKVNVEAVPERSVFGSKNTETGSFQARATNTLHKDLKKLHVQDENEIPSYCHGKSGNSTKYTFQGNRQKEGTIRSMDEMDSVRATALNTPTVEPPPPEIDPFVETSFTFTNIHEQPHMQTPQHGQPGLSWENLFTEFGKPIASSIKRGTAKSTRTKKKNDKSKHPENLSQNFVSGIEDSENVETESPIAYSPMDCSPYRADQAAHSSREASIASDDATQFLHGVSDNTQKSVFAEEKEDLISATQSLKISGNDVSFGEQVDKNSTTGTEKNTPNNSFSTHEPVSVKTRDNFVERCGNLDPNHEIGDTAWKAGTYPFSSKIDTQASDSGTSFKFNLDGLDGCSFTFGASHAGQGSLSSSKRRHRRKSTSKGGQRVDNSTLSSCDPLVSSCIDSFPTTSSALHDLKGKMQSVPMSVDGNHSEKKRIQEARVSYNAAKSEEQEACDKWRLRGNQAYANGKMAKAEEYYTRGVDSITKGEISGSCNRSLMLCYSNRAAAKMSLGRMREALGDCKMALLIDSNFLRAQLRAANCFLALGEIEDAIKHFEKCLQSHTNSSQDEKIVAEATAGMKKSQQAANYTAQFEGLLLKRTPKEAAKALEIIKEALSISPNSEELLEKHAAALLTLRNYHEVIQLCEQTLESSIANSVSSGVNPSSENMEDSEGMECCNVRIWRWHYIAKSYFYLGKLEEALEMLRKIEQVKPKVDKHVFSDCSCLLVTTTDLLRLKASGNGAFQTGKHMEAVEHYTAAITCSTESRPFAAVCFCNRAAAYQALNQIADAIADCCLAIALDPSYSKALSRRATLYEMIRDYEQAGTDLLRLISLLENQIKDKGKESGISGRSVNNSSELNRTRMRLSAVEKEARREVSLDLYMILGVEPTCSAADVKKAYRRAALRHHPDKAGQLLPRSENIDDAVWKELYDEVHRDADRLFKMIGEAYSVLSDPAKRLQYDEEEEIRTIFQKDYNKSRKYESQPNEYSDHYDRSGRRHHWKTYESSPRHRSESSRWSRW